MDSPETPNRLYFGGRGDKRSSSELLEAFSHEQDQEFEADVIGYRLKTLLKVQNFIEDFRRDEKAIVLAQTTCLDLFSLIRLIEVNIPEFRDVTTHPNAADRLKMIAASILQDLVNQPAISPRRPKPNLAQH